MEVHVANLQLNYWRGPIDAWPLSQNIGGPGSPSPQDRRPWLHIGA